MSIWESRGLQLPDASQGKIYPFLFDAEDALVSCEETTVVPF
jgi:hypothetical protein